MSAVRVIVVVLVFVAVVAGAWESDPPFSQTPIVRPDMGGAGRVEQQVLSAPTE